MAIVQALNPLSPACCRPIGSAGAIGGVPRHCTLCQMYLCSIKYAPSRLKVEHEHRFWTVKIQEKYYKKVLYEDQLIDHNLKHESHKDYHKQHDSEQNENLHQHVSFLDEKLD